MSSKHDEHDDNLSGERSIIDEMIEAKMDEPKERQVDNPEWVEYLSRFNESDTVYPRAFVHALLSDPESPLCQNCSHPDPRVVLDVIGKAAEDMSKCLLLQVKHHTLRAKVEKVRDMAKAEACKAEYDLESKLPHAVYYQALTTLLDEDKEKTKDFDPLGYMCPMCGKPDRTKWSDPSDENVCKCE